MKPPFEKILEEMRDTWTPLEPQENIPADPVAQRILKKKTQERRMEIAGTPIHVLLVPDLPVQFLASLIQTPLGQTMLQMMDLRGRLVQLKLEMERTKIRLEKVADGSHADVYEMRYSYAPSPEWGGRVVLEYDNEIATKHSGSQP